jgi:tricorn protease
MAGRTFSLPTLLACSVVLAGFALHAFAQTAPPLLLRNPSLSADKIAFLYADDVWTVSREGGEARRLTSVNAVVDGPYFSPDGARIAYSTLEHGGTRATGCKRAAFWR